MEYIEQIKDLQSLKIENKIRIWKSYMEKYNCQAVAEIGIREGKNFNKFIEHNPLLAVAIDPWTDDGIISRNDKAYKQEKLDEQYNDFNSKMFGKPIKVIRDYSFNVAKQFPNECFDIIYIDADHTYEACLRDIEDWYPKVKKRGVLTGDDYRNHKTKTGVKFGVIKAVQTFIKKNGLEDNFFEMPRQAWGIIKI